MQARAVCILYPTPPASCGYPAFFAGTPKSSNAKQPLLLANEFKGPLLISRSCHWSPLPDCAAPTSGTAIVQSHSARCANQLISSVTDTNELPHLIGVA